MPTADYQSDKTVLLLAEANPVNGCDTLQAVDQEDIRIYQSDERVLCQNL
jgi:hypothetical protein